MRIQLLLKQARTNKEKFKRARDVLDLLIGVRDEGQVNPIFVQGNFASESDLHLHFEVACRELIEAVGRI